MKNLIFIYFFLLSFAAFAEYGQVDNECLKYGQNYVVRGSFSSADPGGKTYNLDRLTNDIDKELNYYSNKPDSSKINCLRQIFEKAKLDSSQYWADRMTKEQCGDENGLPAKKPTTCSADTWEELKKSRNNIRSNEVKYTKILDQCISNGSADTNSCDNSELQKLANSPMMKDMAKAKSAACCDRENGAAYQVLKTFYTLEIRNEKDLQSECTKRTMPDKDGALYNIGAGTIECFKNLILGFCESIKKFGETLSSLDWGAFTEIARLLTSSDGRAKLASTLGQVLKSIGSQISAQFESTFSCFNGYYGVQNTCKLVASIATDFLMGGGIGKLIKSIILPVLKGVIKPFEAAAKMMKESKVAKDLAAKMKPIAEAVGNTKKVVSYPLQKVSQAGLAQARSIALAAKMRMGKPFDNMLSASIKERYITKQVAKASKSSEPPPVNGQFQVANISSTAKPSLSGSLSSAEAKSVGAATANVTNETTSIGMSSLGSTAGKVLRSKVTTKEARSLFSHIEGNIKKSRTKKMTSDWLDKNITKNSLPVKYRNKSSLSLTEKIQAYRESLNQLLKAGTSAEKKRAGYLLTQLDDLAGESTARTSSLSNVGRSSVSTTEARSASNIESAGKTITEKVTDLPEVKLSEIVPDPSKLSSTSKPAWDDLTKLVSNIEKVPLDNPNAPQLMREAWNKYGSTGTQQAQRAHSNIDSMLKRGEISPDGADSLHRIVAAAEQTAFDNSVRPQFLGVTIVTPNTNPGTFEKTLQTGKQLSKEGTNLVKNNKLAAGTYEGTEANRNGRQSEAFDDDTIKNAAVEVEKIENNFKTEKDMERYFSKFNSKEDVENEVDKIKAQISTLLNTPGELSTEHKEELIELMDRLEKAAQNRIAKLEKSVKKTKK